MGTMPVYHRQREGFQKFREGSTLTIEYDSIVSVRYNYRMEDFVPNLRWYST